MRSFPLLCLAAAAAAASVHATPIKAKWGQDMDVVYLSLSVSCVPHTRNVTISNSRFSFQCTSRTSRDEVALAFDFREPMDGSHPKTGCKVVKHGGCGVAGPAVAGRHVLVPSGVRPAACAPPLPSRSLQWDTAVTVNPWCVLWSHPTRRRGGVRCGEVGAARDGEGGHQRGHCSAEVDS